MRTFRAKCRLVLLGVLGFLFSVNASAQLRILPLGDSITEGILGEQSYRKPLRDALDLQGCDYRFVGRRTTNLTPTGFNSNHEGYSGHSVDYFTEATNSNPGIESIMANATPDIVLVHLGSNDMNRNQPIFGGYSSDGRGGTIAEIDRLITEIWNSNADAEIFLANVIPWIGGSANTNISSEIQQLGDAIEALVAGENDSRLHLVDVRSGFDQSNDFSSDGIHPNAFGDSHIADSFLATLNSVGICAQFDNSIPDTFIDVPATSGVVGTTPIFSGTATDLGGSGFNRVNVAIQRIADGLWLNFHTGGFGPISVNGVDVGIRNAILANTSISSTDWSFDATLPPNTDYRLYALAVDNAGNDAFHGTGLSVWPVNRAFTVASPDNTNPTVTVTSPTQGASVSLSLIHI